MHKPLKINDLVIVEWLDSHAGKGWQSKEQLDSAAQIVVCKSVGFLYHRDRICTVIVPHLSDVSEESFGFGLGDMSIPAKAILRIRRLKPI